jgi:hypothetical protein
MTRRGTEMSTRRGVNIVLTTVVILLIAGWVSPVGMAIIVWWLACTLPGSTAAALTTLTLILWAAWPHLIPPLDRDDHARDE